MQPLDETDGTRWRMTVVMTSCILQVYWLSQCTINIIVRSRTKLFNLSIQALSLNYGNELELFQFPDPLLPGN